MGHEPRASRPVRVVVIGSGVAGTSAAIAAHAHGAHVTLVDGGTGASLLATGALDGPSPASPHAKRAFEALGAFAVLAGGGSAGDDDPAGRFGTRSGAILATMAGVLRPAQGHDRALLDLGHAARVGGKVLVARVPLFGWDGAALAASFAEDTAARAIGLTFEHAPIALPLSEEEARLPFAELAARHDDPSRFAELVSHVRALLSRVPGVCGILFPPILGVATRRSEALSEAVGVPCGEALGLPGGPSGLRFERARDEALRTLGITPVEAFATRIETRAALPDEPGSFAVAFGDGSVQPLLTCNAVVVATGGLVGGGLRYVPNEVQTRAGSPRRELPAPGAPWLSASVDGPFRLGVSGRRLVAPATLHGAAPETLVWPFVEAGELERAGILVEPSFAAREGPAGIYACGDAVADHERTWLFALASGAEAGFAAAQRGTGPRPAIDARTS
jgi:hypothetical protein